MLIPDVNILVNAFRPDGGHHSLCRQWLQTALGGSEPIGLLDLVCSGFVRIVTNQRIFSTPASIKQALDFVDRLIEADAVELLSTDPDWWTQFAELCRQAEATGNLITDAHIAAAAKSTKAAVITLDSDFGKFPTVVSRRPE